MPINPSFIKSCVLIFFPLIRSKSLVFFFCCFVLLHSEGNAKLYLCCCESMSSVKGELSGPREGMAGCCDSVSLEIKWEIWLNASMVLTRLRQKGTIFFTIMNSSQLDAANYFRGNSVNSLWVNAVFLFKCINLWISASLCVARFWYGFTYTPTRIWKC